MALNPADRDLSDDELREMFGGEIPYGREIAFLLDEDVDQRVLIGLVKNYGVNIITVQELGLAGETSDYRILSLAREEGRILVSRNWKHYRTIHHRLIEMGEVSHAGIIAQRSRSARTSPSLTSRRIIALSEEFAEEPAILVNTLERI